MFEVQLYRDSIIITQCSALVPAPFMVLPFSQFFLCVMTGLQCSNEAGNRYSLKIWCSCGVASPNWIMRILSNESYPGSFLWGKGHNCKCTFCWSSKPSTESHAVSLRLTGSHFCGRDDHVAMCLRFLWGLDLCWRGQQWPYLVSYFHVWDLWFSLRFEAVCGTGVTKIMGWEHDKWLTDWLIGGSVDLHRCLGKWLVSRVSYQCWCVAR